VADARHPNFGTQPSRRGITQSATEKQAEVGNVQENVSKEKFIPVFFCLTP